MYKFESYEGKDVWICLDAINSIEESSSEFAEDCILIGYNGHFKLVKATIQEVLDLLQQHGINIYTSGRL